MKLFPTERAKYLNILLSVFSFSQPVFLVNCTRQFKEFVRKWFDAFYLRRPVAPAAVKKLAYAASFIGVPLSTTENQCVEYIFYLFTLKIY